MRNHLLATVSATLLLAACSERGALQSTGTGLGPTLVAIDSVILQETADDFVSELSGFAIASNYDSYINDAPTGRILQFDAGGRFVGAFGRKGKGPGELEGVTMLALDGDSVLHALAWGNQRIVAFRTATGEARDERKLPMRTWSIDADAGRIALGGINIARRSSVSILLPGSDSVHAIGPFPSIFVRSPPASSAFGMSQVLLTGDMIVSAYEVTDRLYFTRLDGTILDSIGVPHLRRHGSRMDLFAKVTTDPATGMAAVYQSSLPTILARIAPTRYAFATIDPVIVPNNKWSGAVYLSVVDAATRRSCVDAELPVPADPVPLVDFHGDTVFVLAQHVADDATLKTVIHRYRLDLDQCDWLPEPPAN